MVLTVEQINELLSIIERNQSVVIAKEFGIDFLTDEDKIRLKNSGIDWDALYKPELDTIYSSFNLGMLSEALGLAQTKLVTYDMLKDYISGGEYIPLTKKELFTIQNIKMQAFNDVKTLNGRIFRDVNNILIEDSIQEQQKFIREELEAGYKKKQTVRQIANKIAEKTGDWSRDFDRIIEYASNTAMENGKADMIENNYGEDVKVYKRVYESACKHCIRLYLTGGIGSEPRIFTLKELRANGSNIGRKTDEWKPVIGSTHPYCRCSLHYVPDNSKWNEEKKQFEFEQPKLIRKPIRVRIGGKELSV